MTKQVGVTYRDWRKITLIDKSAWIGNKLTLNCMQIVKSRKANTFKRILI